jgi:bifunctional non-homologous end joining protein LigD
LAAEDAVAMAEKLGRYREKRRFGVTPEPAPGVAGTAGGRPVFVVHKHDARRLHYDLRLEIEGALASWAIPRGPSLDPAVKRLAVETEDHPLAYAEFEGRIPEGEYGAGDSIVWDRGTWETDPPGQAVPMREKGHLAVVLHGEKLQGKWHLVRTRRGPGGKPSWLFFKARDEHAASDRDLLAERPESVVTGKRVTLGPPRAGALKAPHPEPIQLLVKTWPPMLATASDGTAARGPGFVYEVKYDGFRALAGVSGGRVALQSRNGLDLSRRFPEIARALSRLEAAEAVLDGEIVALDEEGRPAFGRLQQAEGRGCLYMAFDLLWLEGDDLRNRPLEERRDLLESLLANEEPPLALAERIEGPGERAYEEARRRGLEGLVAKRIGSRYEGGRSRCWLKWKLHATQDVVVVGYTPISSGGRGIGALLVAVAGGGGFRYAGKVGTGFTDRMRVELEERLAADRIDRPAAAGAPRLRAVTWVRPRLVAEVAFTEWTADGRLRHPSFRGLREDKPLEETAPEPAPVEGSAP